MSRILSSLTRPKGANRRKKRLGYGTSSGHGGTSGRGHKGAKSRSGAKQKPGFEGGQMPLIRRIPKRGFSSPGKKIFQIVNLENLTKLKTDKEINPQVLGERGLIKRKNLPVKILGTGEIKKALTVKAHAFSKSALEKITKSGGKAEVIKNA